MDKNTINSIGGILFTIMGFCFARYYKQIGQKTAEMYGRPEKEVQYYQIGFLICGMSFIIFGLFEIFKVINYR